VLIRIVYLLVRRILGLAVLALCEDMAKDAELLVAMPGSQVGPCWRAWYTGVRNEDLSRTGGGVRNDAREGMMRG